MPAPSSTLPLPPDDIDELIYLTRTNSLADLTTLVTTLSTTHACPPSTIIASAIDVDADGLGSQSSLLHYAAGNGHLETMNYLLGLLVDRSVPARDKTPNSDSSGTPASSTRSHWLLNHKNVNGNTPLHWAAMNGHLDVVVALVRAGADARVRNAAGRDCIVEAEVSALNGRSEAQVKECVVWMLRNCDGVEEGVGGGGKEEEGEEEDKTGEGAGNGDTTMDGNSHGNGNGTTKVQET
ncbi:hypothetical protein PV04_04337 [Phialophora macrospora]|uniref:Uncharacterized protein n=1 Tax=Phialophora macrospora TaxID=1851006 RepID=A0A0D2CT82_9EURO|nr:hypothetical protein PV04_04337 [Phialophora macrospora]